MQNFSRLDDTQRDRHEIRRQYKFVNNFYQEGIDENLYAFIKYTFSHP